MFHVARRLRLFRFLRLGPRSRILRAGTFPWQRQRGIAGYGRIGLAIEITFGRFVDKIRDDRDEPFAFRFERSFALRVCLQLAGIAVADRHGHFDVGLWLPFPQRHKFELSSLARGTMSSFSSDDGPAAASWSLAETGMCLV